MALSTMYCATLMSRLASIAAAAAASSLSSLFILNRISTQESNCCWKYWLFWLIENECPFMGSGCDDILGDESSSTTLFWRGRLGRKSAAAKSLSEFFALLDPLALTLPFLELFCLVADGEDPIAPRGGKADSSFAIFCSSRLDTGAGVGEKALIVPRR